MKVEDAMTRRVRTCRPGDALNEVMRIMWEHDLGALPVVNDEGQPIAMITDRDIAVAAYTQGRPLSQLQVQLAMSRKLHSVHVSDPLAMAERTMGVHRVRRVPVVDESTRLVGIVSLSDLARLHVRTLHVAAGERAPDEVAPITRVASERNAPSEHAAQHGQMRQSVPFRDRHDDAWLVARRGPHHRLPALL